MPVSVHKLLVHGPEVVTQLLYPVGIFSEEAQESRNKDSKSIRLHHTRKANRVLTNTDHFKHLLVTSDPLLSTISSKIGRCRNKKKENIENIVELKRLLILEEEDYEPDKEIEDLDEPDYLENYQIQNTEENLIHEEQFDLPYYFYDN